MAFNFHLFDECQEDQKVETDDSVEYLIELITAKQTNNNFISNNVINFIIDNSKHKWPEDLLNKVKTNRSFFKDIKIKGTDVSSSKLNKYIVNTLVIVQCAEYKFFHYCEIHFKTSKTTKGYSRELILKKKWIEDVYKEVTDLN